MKVLPFIPVKVIPVTPIFCFHAAREKTCVSSIFTALSTVRSTAYHALEFMLHLCGKYCCVLCSHTRVRLELTREYRRRNATAAAVSYRCMYIRNKMHRGITQAASQQNWACWLPVTAAPVPSCCTDGFSHGMEVFPNLIQHNYC